MTVTDKAERDLGSEDDFQDERRRLTVVSYIVNGEVAQVKTIVGISPPNRLEQMLERFKERLTDD